MNKLSFRAMLMLVVLLAAGATVFAQDGSDPGEQDPRPGLLRELKLTPDQVQALTALNQAHRPAMQTAQRSAQAARAALDAAIYADTVDDASVTARLRELQAAQAEVVSLRFNHELAIRRVLTAEQLIRFRELRQRYSRGRQRMMGPEGESPGRPLPGRRRPGMNRPPGI